MGIDWTGVLFAVATFILRFVIGAALWIASQAVAMIGGDGHE